MPLRYQFLIVLVCFLGAAFVFLVKDTGKIIDSHKGVPVRSNGVFEGQTHGDSYASNGYYYGIKWQCVEFVRRFYKIAKHHEMPDKTGDARDYFDTALPDGSFNPQRGMVQYSNGSRSKPMEDDLVVFHDGRYGHVAIITEVDVDSLELINQNTFGKTRHRLRVDTIDDHYFIRTPREVAGWLRLPETASGSPDSGSDVPVDHEMRDMMNHADQKR